MITDYNHLSIGKYLEIQKIAKDDIESIDKQVGFISVLTDMAEDDVLDLPIVEYKKLAEQSKFLAVPMKVPQKIAKVYSIGEWELIPSFDIYKMTTAQYIDFQTFSKLGDDQLVNIMSCFLIPKGKKYNDGYDIAELQKAIRDFLPAPDCMALTAFFLNELKLSMKAMLIYCKMVVRFLKKDKRKEMKEKIDSLMRIQDNLPNGDGFLALML